jgi:hypothetical protein
MASSSDYDDDDYESEYSDEQFEDEDDNNRAPPSLAPTTDDDMPSFNDSRYQSSNYSSKNSTPRQHNQYNALDVEKVVVHRNGIRGRPSSRQQQDQPFLPPTYDDSDENYSEDSVDYSEDGEYSSGQKKEMTDAVSLPSLAVQQEAAMKMSASQPLLPTITSHPIITSKVQRRKKVRQYGEFVDKDRPWIQRRAAQVHHEPSIFSGHSRPQIPRAILSSSSWNVADRHQNNQHYHHKDDDDDNDQQHGKQGQRHKRRKRRKRHRRRQWTESSVTLPDMNMSESSSVGRIVKGGNHFSMLATADRKWAFSTEHYTNDTTHRTVNSADTEELSVFFFEKLISIMKVYRLRSKDLFASLDRDSNGIIGQLDMYESLQVLGVVDLRPKEVKRLIRHIVRMSGGKSLDFRVFEFAMRRANAGREKSLRHRMGRYIGNQNALSSKILASQEVKSQSIAAAGTEVDATRAIGDIQGRLFWKNSFSSHTTSVSLKRFMLELKKHFLRLVAINEDDSWVFRRIQSFVSSTPGKVTSTSFGQLLKTFGPMNRLLENVLGGPLISRHTSNKIRHKKRHEQQMKKDAKKKSNFLKFSRGSTKISNANI